MAKIDINTFQGIMPKMANDKLPEGYGQTMSDANTASHALAAYKRSTPDVALSGNSYKSLFEYTYSNTNNWVYYDGVVFHSRSHVAEDTHERMYIMGESGLSAQGTLTLDTLPTATDTMTIDTTTYLFVAYGAGANPLDIEVGQNRADAQANITAAIEGTDGYNTTHTTVTIGTWSSDEVVLSAVSHGTAGNSIVTTETFSAGSNVFDAVTLGTTQAGAEDGLYKAFANDIDSSPWDFNEDFYYPGAPSGTAPTITAQSAGATYLAYYYTYVSRYGEEGPGSAITEITNQTVDGRVHVDDIEAAPADHGLLTTVGTNVPKVRIYRTATDGAGGSDFYLVCEATYFDEGVTYVAGDYVIYATDLYECTVGGVGTWAGGTHTFLQGEAVAVADLALSTTADTYLWDAADDDLTNLRSHPNGFFVASKNNELHFSEPFYHHAWPEDYKLPLDSQIVGIGIFGSTIVVLTDAWVYTFSGPHPDSLYKQRLAYHPCLSQRAVIEIDEGVMFPSEEGFQLVNASGITNITSDIFKPEDLTDYYLSSMHGVWYNRSYFGFYSGTNGEGFIKIDFTNMSVTSGITYHQATYVALSDGIFRTIVNSSIASPTVAYISKWDADTTSYNNYGYKSPRFIFSKLINFKVAQVYIDFDFYFEVQNLLGTDDTLTNLNNTEWAGTAGTTAPAKLEDACVNDFVVNSQDANGDNLYSLASLGVQEYITFKIYADSVLKFTKEVSDNLMFKLPRGFKGKEWEVEVSGMIPVKRIMVATSTEELLNG